MHAPMVKASRRVSPAWLSDLPHAAFSPISGPKQRCHGHRTTPTPLLMRRLQPTVHLRNVESFRGGRARCGAVASMNVIGRERSPTFTAARIERPQPKPVLASARMGRSDRPSSGHTQWILTFALGLGMTCIAWYPGGRWCSAAFASNTNSDSPDTATRT